MLLKECRKVAPPEDDAFDSDRLIVGLEQNNVVPTTASLAPSPMSGRS